MWFFYSPKVIYGENALEFLEQIKGKKCVIITDNMLVKLGIVKKVTDKLDKLGKKYKIFSEVEPDPSEETAWKAVNLCKEYAPEIIIAVGGGSSMDTAKVAWALSARPELVAIDDLHPFEGKLNDLGMRPGDPVLVAIPTTAGTGSEATWATIITRTMEDGTHIKLEQAHRSLIPTYAIVDPQFTASMPPKLTASTGMDAAAHIFEGIISAWRNEFSEALGIKAYSLIREYLPRAYKNGDDMEAREKMGIAATMAGMTFGNSQVIIGHSLGHTLGAVFKIPHGLAVGVFLPYILQFCINDPEKDEVVKILGRFAKMVGAASWDMSDKEASLALIEDIKKVQKSVDFPTTLADLGIKKEELEEKLDMMADITLKSGSAVMSPRTAGTSEIKKFYLYAYDGKEIDF